MKYKNFEYVIDKKILSLILKCQMYEEFET